jgi:PAS domain S-box-containing protein
VSALAASAFILAGCTAVVWLARQAVREAERLRRMGEHLALAQRVSATGSFELDLRTRRITWSDETYRIFGLQPGFGPLNQDVLESFVLPEDRRRLREQIAAVASTGRSDGVWEYRIRRPDGGVRILHREVELARDPRGRPEKLVGVIKDVTALREAERRGEELERQLLHSQKLEALGTLAGGVAHDLNNTLMPILALANLVLEELPEASPLRADLETILQAGGRARDLVKQILAFSRKEDFAREEVDLGRVTREALRMLRAGLPARIAIEERIAAAPKLCGNAGELHQAVVNLVTNAAQAIGAEAGRITVSIASAADDGAAPAICLAVADTGCGIDAAALGRVFEPFFTTKRVGEGTGLGLAVVHGIVTRHGGRIEVDSRPGRGSRFTVTFPALAPSPALPALAAAVS